MAAVERFEDLGVWQKARQLTRRVYETTRDGPSSRDFGYRDQIRRAAMSVMLNISEGFERESGDKDFRHFLSIAKGSVGEVRAALYVGVDCGYLTPPAVRRAARAGRGGRSHVEPVHRLPGRLPADPLTART